MTYNYQNAVYDINVVCYITSMKIMVSFYIRKHQLNLSVW